MEEKTGSNMLHKSEKDLSNFSKKLLYDSYCRRFALIYSGETCASKSYFYQTWKKHRRFIKVRKVPSFTKCSECECLRIALLQAGTDGTDTTELLAPRDAHV